MIEGIVSTGSVEFAEEMDQWTAWKRRFTVPGVNSRTRVAAAIGWHGISRIVPDNTRKPSPHPRPASWTWTTLQLTLQL